MEKFNYYRPTKPADAVKFIKKATDGKFMSGGMTLIPTMKQGLATPYRHRRSRRLEEFRASRFRARRSR